MLFESEKVEFKSQMLEDLYKEVIAFANTDGGIIYIGVDDQGNLTLTIPIPESPMEFVTPFSLMSLCLFAMFSRITR